MQSRPLAIKQIAVGFTASGDGAAANPATVKINDAGAPTGNLQVSIVGTSASVSVFGRGNPLMPWILVTPAITASGITAVPLMPEMYAQVTAIVAAQVDASISYPIAGQ